MDIIIDNSNNSKDYDDDNIFFSIQDKYTTDNYITEINDSISEISDMNGDTPSFLDMSTDGELYRHLCSAVRENEYSSDVEFDLSYYKEKKMYDGDNYSYYEKEYTVKGLMKICEYYNIHKDIKSLKCKKTDIISTIIYFESLAENEKIVYRRNQMWAYIDALSKDNMMRKYIIWE